MTSDQLALVVFAENPQPRCPVLLLLDVSGSMFGQPIAELNLALGEFGEALRSDQLASLRVEILPVTFGGIVQEGQFITADNFLAPMLSAEGETPMGAAVLRALELLRERKELYKRAGVDYFRPWMIILTDGVPTDSGVWEMAADQLRLEEQRKGVIVYPVAVGNADVRTLARFSDERPPIRLHGLAFREMFQWLSKSLSVVSHSRPGEQIPLPPVGWGQVDTSI
jgi:uncharacterized protein YegL